MVKENNGNGYKLIRNLLLGLLMSVLIQIPGYIWYAARLSSQVEYLRDEIKEIKIQFKEHTTSQTSSENLLIRIDEKIKQIDINTQELKQHSQRLSKLETKKASFK